MVRMAMKRRSEVVSKKFLLEPCERESRHTGLDISGIGDKRSHKYIEWHYMKT